MEIQATTIDIVQLAITVFLMITSAAAGWSLKNIFRLSLDLEAVRVRMEETSKNTVNEIMHLRSWMTQVDSRLADLMKNGCAQRCSDERPV